MKDWKNFIRKNWILIVLGIIILGAVFVRVYKFEDWLYFRADQARDAKLAVSAFDNGPGELTLLGPRAAGTFLRLGPVFYYMQYASTLIFNSVEPHILAFPDLFFSILTIPLLFYFLRQFFSVRNSLLLTTLYSFSFIIVQYSRFAWNPNSITFWGLLFVLGLHKASQETDGKKGGKWLILTALAYSISSQLHFVAFAGYSVMMVLFWVLYFPRKINWKYWLMAILVGLFFYIPVVLSDIYTHGDNLGQFFYALTAKSGGEGSVLVDKLKMISTAFTMFLTSYGHKNSIVSMWGGLVLTLSGIGTGAYFWLKNKKQRQFIYLIFIWFSVFIILQIKTDTSLKPRFFMPIASIPFIFLGFIYVFLEKFKIKFFEVLIFGSALGVLLANFGGMKIAYSYFNSQDQTAIGRKIFIKQDDAKVLEYHKLATRYMAQEAQKNNKIACFYSTATYERTYEYLFEVYHPEIKYDRISKSFENKESCQYFSIITVDNPKRMKTSYTDFFDFSTSKKFGRIEIWNAIARDSFINYGKGKEVSDEAEKEAKTETTKTNQDIQAELKESLEKEIKEILNGSGSEDQTEKPDRLERVQWKHIFGEIYEE